MVIRTFALGAVLAMGLAVPVLAQDAALYDPSIPASAVFIRALSAAGEKGKEVEVAGRVALTGADGTTPYQVAAEGEIVLRAGGSETKVKALPGKTYTVVLADKTWKQVFEDPRPTEPGKSAITLYNLSDIPKAVIFAPTAKAAVVADVAPGTSASRAMKVVTVDKMEVRNGDTVVASFDNVALKAGVPWSCVLTGTGGTYKATLVPVEIGKK